MKPEKTPEHPNTPEDSRGALLMPPSPPAQGTIRVLISSDCTWTWREVPGATQLDIFLGASPPRHVRGGPR